MNNSWCLEDFDAVPGCFVLRKIPEIHARVIAKPKEGYNFGGPKTSILRDIGVDSVAGHPYAIDL